VTGASGGPPRDPRGHPDDTAHFGGAEQGNCANWRLLLLMLGAAVLRLYCLSSHAGFGVDEATTVVNSMGSAKQAVLWDAGNNPPLQHLLINLLSRVDASEAVLRLPGALFGVGTVYCTFRLVEALVSREAALCAGSAVAVSPFHILNSMNARMYSAAMFFSIASLWFTVRALKSDRRAHWAVVCALSTLGLYTHYLVASFLPVHWMVVLSSRPRARTVLRLLFVHGVIALLFLPWLLSFLLPSMASQVGAGGNVRVAALTACMALLDFLFGVTSGLPPVRYPVLVSAGCLVAMLLIVFAVDDLRRNPVALTTLGFGFLGPFLLMFLVSVTNWRHTTQHFILALPMFLALCGVGFSALRDRWHHLAWAYAAPLVALAAFSHWNYVHSPSSPKTDWRAACEYIGQHLRTHDVAFLVASNTLAPVNYYLDNRITRCGLPGNSVRSTDYPEVAVKCERAAAGADRLWLVESGSQAIEGPDRTVYRWCQHNLRLLEGREFGSVRVKLFVRRGKT